ncbi:diguanylate cyclase (GGDEF)-like protein [Sphingomonas jejuensis]|uniref:diguanylate cyclase n=1 Tax=Sphingomonas jejuensis TaxID=904715 RepID=A0ABX0XLF9_9SPHN|nr:GGDEF domain-containing protein [Sphingomonas jejuensis]NJC33998.1 diguanylate cyclase (GGDEF)-like protein [Sphingomonas jejuensis]
MTSGSKQTAVDGAPPHVDDDVHAELVALMFHTMTPLLTVGGMTIGLSLLVGLRTGHWQALLIACAAGLVTAFRIGCFIGYRREAQPKRSRLWERRYALGTTLFSAVLASFSIYAFAMGNGNARVMAVVMVVGYCAGIVTRASVRPQLAVRAVIAAAVPLTIVAGAGLTPERIGIAVALAALIVVSLDTVKNTYAITVDQIVTRRAFARQAAFDGLTGLANRTMLEERLAALLASGRSGVGVHFIDLDHFKLANDTHGHAAGDAVLRVVGERLRAIGHPVAFAARYGGDEFVVVQAPVTRLEEVERLGITLVDLIGTACWWNGKEVPMGASVGSIVVDRAHDDAAAAIAAADAAMIAAKRTGRGRAVLRPLEPVDGEDPAGADARGRAA